jgi:uncharacterized protein (TIGR02246 family)
MKYFNILVIACAFPLLGISQDGDDKKLVTATAQSWFNSFNKHNYDDFFDYIAEDCFGINPLGKYMRMTSEAPAIFNKGHEGLLRNLSIEVDSIDVRFIDSDVAIATVFSQEKGTIYPPDGIDRGNNKVDGQGLVTTMIIVRRNKKWLITQYQSTHISNP